MRMFSVIGALVLAAMCLAFPVAAASPAEQITFDRISHEMIVAPTFGFAHVDAIALDAADLVAIASTGAAEKAAGNCSDYPAWVGVDSIDGVRAERLPACNPRKHDPGWRNS